MQYFDVDDRKYALNGDLGKKGGLLEWGFA